MKTTKGAKPSASRSKLPLAPVALVEQPWFWLMILVLGIVTIYKPVTKFDMINWDEKRYLIETPFIKNINVENIKAMFTQKVLASYNPIVLLSYAIDYKIAKEDWGWYHGVNVFFHLLNAILLFACLRKLRLKTSVAGLVTFLFALHPMAVEAVAWLAGRKDMLYTFFFLLSWLYYLMYKEKGKTNLIILSVVFALLSCLSKIQAITLPFILLLSDRLLDGKLTAKQLLNKIPYFILSVVFGLAAISGTTLVADKYEAPPDFFDKVMYSVMAFGMYVERLIVPFGLSAIHRFPLRYSTDYWISFSVGVAIICFLLFIVLRYFKKAPYVTTGLLFFGIQIFPVLHIIGYNSAIIYERFTYLAGVGLFVSILSLDELLPAWSKSKLKIVGAFAAILMVFTIQRIPVWKNGETLWTDVIQKDQTAEQAYNNRGQYYDDRGEYEKALADFNSSIAVSPGKPDAWNNKCVYYFRKKDWVNAIKANDVVLSIEPKHIDGLSNRGGIYFNEEQYDSALYYYNKAAEYSPKFASAYYNLGATYYKLKNFRTAADQFLKAINYFPEYSKACTFLALTYAQLDKFDSAFYYSGMAERLSVKAGAYRAASMEYISIGNQAYAAGDTAKALASYLSGAQIDPTNAETFYDVGGVYLMMKDIPKAREYWKKTLSVNPQHVNATDWLQRTGGMN